MRHRKLRASQSILLIIALVVSLCVPFVGPSVNVASASETPLLTISGTGLERDVAITDWSDYTPVERYYSTNNSVNSHKIYKVKGYDLWEIIGEENLIGGDDCPVKFISGTFSATKTVGELKSLNYYPNLLESSREDSSPMLSFYRKALTGDNFGPITNPVSWEDAPITDQDIDMSAPRLSFGQINVDQTNESQWVKEVEKILVGEERPIVFTASGSGLDGDKQFSMADLKNVPEEYKIEEAYIYNSKGGQKSADVKGVSLWYVLNTVIGIKDQSAPVKFITSDGYDIQEQTLTDISDQNLNYVLAYEVDGQAVNDDNGKAQLRIYRKIKTEGEFDTVYKAITGITVVSDGSIDFSTSPYKHINYTTPPLSAHYNVDSITSATLTIEGPGVKDYRALSLRQLEEANAGLARGTYAETMNGVAMENSYEGITISYLLDNFVTMRENAGDVILKDKNRKTIGTFSLEDIRRTDYLNSIGGNANLPMMVAYGINEVPLVFLDSDVGYSAEKRNDNGCFKLALGQNSAADPVPEFSNIAYIYVTEADAANVYEHVNAPYDDPKYTNYLITLTGSGLGKEVNYTVADIESSAMDDIRLQREYSLSNSEYYWYYKTYKGVGLWDLLLKSGIDPNIDEDTVVRLIAADNYNFAPITIRDIKDSSLYGYYEKDALDMGDGKFDGTDVEPLETGFKPVLAYGFDGYPYVMHPTDAGFNSGLLNDGGPVRLIFGKKNYADTNGSNQVQYLKKVVIGEDTAYPTHSYGNYAALADNTVAVKVTDGESLISEKSYTLKELEDMVYNVPAAESDKAKVKDSYFTKFYGEEKISDLYEGVGLWYLLGTKVGLPGTTGTVTFKGVSSEGVATSDTVSLEDIQKTYFNEVSGSQSLKPVLAYAKNGYPMVAGKDSGYVSAAKNNGGPLTVLMGQTTEGEFGLTVSGVTEIVVNIEKDPYAHLDAPYDAYADDSLTISGLGARKQVTTTVRELENLQDYIISGQYYMLNSNKVGDEGTYKGIDLYNYLNKEVGFTPGATGVTFVPSDNPNETVSFTLAELQATYLNEVSGASNLKVMLAYGRDEKPLVPNKDSSGYDNTAKNSGGPLRLIVGQTEAGDVNSGYCLKFVSEIIIEGQETTSWKHDVGVYQQYQDMPVLRITGDQVKAPHTFTVKELEELNAQIIRDTYSGDGIHDFEGVILWQLIKDVVGLKDGVEVPSSLRVYSGQGYNQILSNFDQVKNGVENSQGLNKPIILAYAMDGYPLVPSTSSVGYENNNANGPVRLIIEENKSMWIKNTDCIVVGSGSYEDPVTNPNEPVDPEPVIPPGTEDFALYLNDDASGVPSASIRSVTSDNQGGLWVGTYGGGAAYRDAAGLWTTYDTTNSGLLDNVVYDIEVDQAGRVWMAVGGPTTAKGLMCKDGDVWTQYTTENSGLPADFIYTITPDNSGGMWLGTGLGAAYRAKNGTWTVYDTKDGIPAGSVNVITTDNKGGVWFGCYPDTINETAGTYAGGYAYRSAGGQWTVYKDAGNTNFGDNWVRSISVDADGGAWIVRSGNYEGGGKVDYVSPAGQKQIYDNKDLYPGLPEGDTIRLAAADPDGGLWMATKYSGLLYRNSEGQITAGYSGGNEVWPTAKWNDVYFLNVDSRGSVFVGTNGGVAYLAGQGEPVDNNPQYVLTPGVSLDYTSGSTDDGINIMTVNKGVKGTKNFSVRVSTVIAHTGDEYVVFTHTRDGVQMGWTAVGGDFDVAKTAHAKFNVQAGDVVKVFIVDDITGDVDVNPMILE